MVQSVDDYNSVGRWLGGVLRYDDRQKFVILVKSNLDSSDDSHNLVASDVFSWVILTGAVRCATALLEGETGLSVDINADVEYGACPLHHAASLLKYELVDLLLRHGARTDVKSSKHGDSFPIDVALESFNEDLDRIDPTSKESLNKLFAALCHTQMKEPLNTIRLLVRGTKNLTEVLNNYANEGKLIQLAVLLIVAKDCTTPLNTLQSNDSSIFNGSMSIHKSILKEMGSLVDAQSKLSIVYGGRSELIQKCEAKREALMSALMLLHLFEKAGDAIGLYFQSPPNNIPKERVARDIAVIIDKAGCFLQDFDLRNIDCKSSEIKEALRSLEKITAGRPKQHLGFPLNPPPARICDAKWESWSRPPGIQVEQMKRSYHTWSPALRSDLPAHRFLRHYSGYNELRTRSNGETIATHRPKCLPSKSSNLLASLALAFNRGIRHI